MAVNLQRSAVPLRRLSAADLGVAVTPAFAAHASNRADDAALLPDYDPTYVEVRDLLKSYGGVIFTGPPGTSKSYAASAIASKLAGSRDRVRFIQFHPSYQYEDFIQGYVPDESTGTFKLKSKHFVEMCRAAEANPNETFVLVIDELSRGDPGRIFGEALTYVEKSKRGLIFDLASGEVCAVPANLVLLATMNPMDRGVDEVDAAFERRFAKISMDPDPDLLLAQLNANGVESTLRDRLMAFFRQANGLARRNPQGAIGHTYFFDVTDAATLQSVWDHQLQFLIERAYQLDVDTRDRLFGAFGNIFEVQAPPSDPGTDEPASSD